MPDRANRSGNGGAKLPDRGDFQTPAGLANAVCAHLLTRGLRPANVIEPTCGRGHLLIAAAAAFPAAKLLGFELNRAYATEARQALANAGADADVTECDFFDVDWDQTLALEGPLLVLANPPWVTNAALGRLGSDNLPDKRPTPGMRGLDARTGASNFDISEWMLLRLLEALRGRSATVAVLIKTSVARRVLRALHGLGQPVECATMHRIDAKTHFGATVDACLLCVTTAAGTVGETVADFACLVYARLGAHGSEATLGFRGGELVADTDAFDRAAPYLGATSPAWRSGVKHDARAVMELRPRGEIRVNGHGDGVDIEDTLLFPLLKGSDLQRGSALRPERWLLLPQRRVGEDTAPIATLAPRTWAYLQRHGEALDRRRSRIYRGQPRFSVFGVGDYAFAPWKVCIAGFYRSTDFVLVGPVGGKPVMLDDTCYFIGFDDERTARRALRLLSSDIARDVLRAFAFWDEKRPIKKGLLSRLCLTKLEQAAQLHRQ